MSCSTKELCDRLRANDLSITGLSLPIYDQSCLRKVHVLLLMVGLDGLSAQNLQFSALCLHLSESNVLQSVTFTCCNYSGCSSLPGRLIRALTEISHIQQVRFCKVAPMHYWYKDFLAFLQSKTQSLKQLSVPSVPWTDELGKAVGSLQALEYFATFSSVDCPMEIVLLWLQSCQCLWMLSIYMEDQHHLLDHMIVWLLSSLLCSEVSLVSLKLESFMISRDPLLLLLQAMCSCSTLVHLVLNVEWEVKAALEMATWFSQPGESSLRELCFQAYCMESMALMTMTLTPADDSPQHSSAGAMLQVLEIDTHMDDIEILALALTTKHPALRTLSLISMDSANIKQLT
jgi:hypothetical protein